jgi:hypothetical protein
MHKRMLQILFSALMLCSGKGFAQHAVDRVEDSARFNEVSKTTTVEIRKIADSTIENLKKDDDYWYANMVPEKEKPVEIKRTKGLLDEQWFRILMWVIIVGGFIAVVVWYLTSSNIMLFRKNAKKINVDEEEEISEDIFALNYEKEIQKAVSEKNYRLAVRLMYLQTLKRLSEKNEISYTHERTNSDYLAELLNTRFYTDFFRLTRNFEYTWYGQFDLSVEAFSMMQNDFSHFKSQLG